MAVKKAILFGDYSNPNYHPIKGIDQEISAILADELSVTSTENYGELTSNDLKDYDMIICYADRWREKSSPRLVHAILSFVSGGKGLLVIHNGVFMHRNYELAQMIGAKFVKHPKYDTLQYRIVDSAHPVMANIEEFSMGEEPYQFELDPFTETTMLLEYEFEGELWPAAWAHEYGLGKVVHLAPGHDVESFKQPMFRNIILNSAKWLGV